jgi:hypothetical protein
LPGREKVWRRNLFAIDNAAGERLGKAICCLAQRFGLIGTIGQRLLQVREPDDDAAVLIGLRYCGIAVGDHQGPLLLKIALAQPELGEYRVAYNSLSTLSWNSGDREWRDVSFVA